MAPPARVRAPPGDGRAAAAGTVSPLARRSASGSVASACRSSCSGPIAIALAASASPCAGIALASAASAIHAVSRQALQGTPVGVVGEDRLTAIAAQHHVVLSALDGDPLPTRRGVILAFDGIMRV
jgi:hypothetical protein